MKHYDYVEWLLYKSKSLSDEVLEEMEEHLYNCDFCMGIFLSLVDEKELNMASEVVPEDFTQNIMNRISKEKIKVVKEKRPNKSFNYSFMYYVAVASVTIFLTFGGFFTNLVDSVPELSIRLEVNVQSERKNPINDFTERVIKNTSKLIGSIEDNEFDFRRNNHER